MYQRLAGAKKHTAYLIELKPAQQFRAFPAGEILSLMNIGVADDHANQRFGLYQNGGLGGESLEAVSWRGRMEDLRARTLTI